GAGERGGHRRGRADLPRTPAHQRVPARRGPTVHRGRGRAGRCAGGRAGPVPGAADPGGGGLMDELVTTGATRLGAAISQGQVSAEEVTRAHLDRIGTAEPAVNAFLHVATDAALEQARAIDRRRGAGEKLGPLAGVPLALKDVLTWTQAPTTCASRMLEGWVPPYDATVTRRLTEAGIVILGKTNLDEFAMGSSTENSAYGTTRNPWDLERTPGGSGGGSSAALAAGMAPLAIGTDTGGSIRQPAALTNTVGVKPTYGTVSRYGLIACASSLDQGGPAARTVEDTARLHQVIAGFDQNDATSSR